MKSQSHLITKAVSLLGVGAIAALASLPAQAQMSRDTTKNNSDDVASEMKDSTNGPSVVPGETTPGPSETPSGSPSVPGNSSVDDPGMTEDSGVRRESYNNMGDRKADEMSQEDDNVGPSVVPSETTPGPSETPSGSPSVPGNSSVDDPGMAREDGDTSDSINPSTEMEMDEESDDATSGPSVVPGEGTPGPSETPSGSPALDDAGKIN